MRVFALCASTSGIKSLQSILLWSSLSCSIGVRQRDIPLVPSSTGISGLRWEREGSMVLGTRIRWGQFLNVVGDKG